jgi:phage protein U
LNGVTFPVKSGQTALNIGEDIDAEASKGRPLYLFNSLGDSLGQWVILKRELENELLTADGYPRSVTYSITIAQVKAPDKQLGGPSGGGEVIV